MSEFSLRPVEDSDHEWLCSLHNDPNVLQNMTNDEPITLESHLAWWEKTRRSTTEERLVFCVDGARAGFTKFYSIDRRNERCILGADLHADFRGKGLARIMWSLMLERCFVEHRLNRVSLTTAEYNGVAIHVYKTMGFKEEGRFIRSLKRGATYHDEILMYMLREDYEKNSPDSR